MGCTSSSLAGEDFKHIDATALSSEQAPRHSTKPIAEDEDATTAKGKATGKATAKAKDYAENENRFGSNAYMASLPFTGKPREPKKKKKKNLPPAEDSRGPDSTASTEESPQFVDKAEQLVKPILRTDQDRVARVEAEGKKLGPYQRWMNKKLGPGEGESLSVSE